MRTPLALVALTIAAGAANHAAAQTNGAAPAPSAAPPAAASSPSNAPSPSAAPSAASTSAASAAEPAPAAQPAPTEQSAEPPPAATPAPPVPAETRAPEALAPEPTPATMLGVNTPAAKRDEASSAPRPSAWLDGHAIGVEALLRVGTRFGSTPGADSESRAGLGFDAGIWARLASEYAFGLVVKRSSLGSLALTEGQAAVNAQYAATALDLAARAYPLHGASGEIFLGLRVGLVWQHVEGSGLRPSVNLQPPEVFTCSGGSGPGFALGAELGGSLRLARSFFLTGNLGFDGYHLDSDRIDQCVAGVGSTTALSFGAGFLYAFDLDREAKVAASPRTPRF
jgi:hypothetical protein